MPDVPVSTEMEARPGVRRVQSYLEWLRGPDPTEEEAASHLAIGGFVATPRAVLQGLGRLREQVGEFSVASWDEPLPGLFDVQLDASNGRVWRFAARTTADADERIMKTTLLPKPPGFTVRPPRPDEVARLAAIDAETPIRVGDIAIVYERDARDYFADERLMGDAADFGVVERADGEVVGVCCLAARDVTIGGVRRHAAAYTRARVAPAAQGGGARGHMVFFGFFHEARRECDFAYSLIAAGNDAMLRSTVRMGVDGVPERAVLDTSTGTPSGVGRQGTAQDAPQIVRLLNATHAGEEFFLPYTTGSLGERLSKAPDLYSWSSFRLTERAVVGLRPHTFRVHRREGDGPETIDSRALCLDYGFEPGAEAEFESLLRGALHELAENGDTELSIFTSRGARGYDLLVGMAKRQEPYLVQLPRVGTEDTRPVYVDQIYF